MLVTVGNKSNPLTEKLMSYLISTESSVFKTPYAVGDIINMVLIRNGGNATVEMILDSEIERFLTIYELCPVSKNSYIKIN